MARGVGEGAGGVGGEDMAGMNRAQTRPFGQAPGGMHERAKRIRI